MKENEQLIDLFIVWYWDNKGNVGNKDFWKKNSFAKELSYYMKEMGRWKNLPRGNPKEGYNKMKNKVSKVKISEDLF
jgi:hypothetical protein